jgi:CTP synthase (UTP-ammonia lyase)
MIIEYARNVLMLEGVGHAEFDPEADSHIIVPLQCSLRGLEGNISISPDTLVRQLYQVDEATEKFYCSFGVSASHVNAISQTGLRVVGTDEQGLVRVTELSDHPFFIGTLFVPQARALKGEFHPLIEGLIKCASMG